MFRNIFFACALALLPVSAGWCQTAYPLPGAGRTATVPANGSAGLRSAAKPAPPLLGEAQWDFGVVDVLHTDHVEHTFTLKNTTQKVVTVNRLRGSCGCETLFLAKNGAESTSATLTPGEQVQVRVSVRINASQSGEMHKFAWAYGPDGSEALATLDMRLTLRQAVTFTPDVLDFGALTVGDTKSLPVTLTMDADALSGKTPPTLVSSNPNVSIISEGPEQSVTRDGKPARARSYRLTLAAPTDAGSVTGTIHLEDVPGAPPALSSATAPLVGTVVGHLTAEPKALFFGSVPAGQGMTREVALMDATAQHGQPLAVSCDNPWLTAQIHNLGGAPLLQVQLKKDAPAGAVQAQVMIQSASGERLAVPVVGEVLKSVSSR